MRVQILPQLLYHLKVDRVDGSSVDWGTLLIYTCPNSCVVEVTSPLLLLVWIMMHAKH